MATTSRTTLRRTLMDRLGDGIVLKATHVSASPDTFRDTINLGDRGDNAPSLLNKIAYLTLAAAPTTGYEARITGYDSSDRILTFTPDAGSTLQVDDEMELWSVTERVGSIATVHRLLNDGIRAVGDEVGTETWTMPRRSAPAPRKSLSQRRGLNTAGRPSSTAGAPTVTCRPTTTTSWRAQDCGPWSCAGRSATRANNRSVRIWGYARPSEMTADSGANGETTVNPEWLVESVLGWIALAASARASDIRGPSEDAAPPSGRASRAVPALRRGEPPRPRHPTAVSFTLPDRSEWLTIILSPWGEEWTFSCLATTRGGRVKVFPKRASVGPTNFDADDTLSTATWQDLWAAPVSASSTPAATWATRGGTSPTRWAPTVGLPARSPATPPRVLHRQPRSGRTHRHLDLRALGHRDSQVGPGRPHLGQRGADHRHRGEPQRHRHLQRQDVLPSRQQRLHLGRRVCSRHPGRAGGGGRCGNPGQ